MGHIKKFIIPVFVISLTLTNGNAISEDPTNKNVEPRAKPPSDFSPPIVIAHRGASGHLPEHTLAAYSIAIFQGADYIEPDVVITKDRHLIIRHENVLNLTTDVADRTVFSSRKATKIVDGETVTGWFSEDFTLAEIKRLRAIERIPQLRPHNAAFNGQFEIPTLQEVIDFVRKMEEITGRAIGIYPEIKHPTYFDNLHLSMEEPLVQLLRRNGYETEQPRVYIQSFEVGSLKALHTMTTIPLIQLLRFKGQPYDIRHDGGTLTYAQMTTPEGLMEIAGYADGVAPEKYHFLIPKDEHHNLLLSNATTFIHRAHSLGLKVHAYTFRAENFFLPANYKKGGNPLDLGNSQEEIEIFLKAGVDGLFTDHPYIGVKAREHFLGR